jgi:hypothetical protein
MGRKNVVFSFILRTSKFLFSLHRFEEIGLNWQDIPEDVRLKLENRFETTVDKFGPGFDLQWILKYFVSLKYVWTKNKKLRESVSNAFCRIFDLQRGRNSLQKDGNSDKINVRSVGRFSSCVYYFGEAGMNWNDVSSEVKEIIIGRSLQYCETFSALQLKNLLIG